MFARMHYFARMYAWVLEGWVGNVCVFVCLCLCVESVQIHAFPQLSAHKETNHVCAYCVNMQGFNMTHIQTYMLVCMFPSYVGSTQILLIFDRTVYMYVCVSVCVRTYHINRGQTSKGPECLDQKAPPSYFLPFGSYILRTCVRVCYFNVYVASNVFFPNRDSGRPHPPPTLCHMCSSSMHPPPQHPYS